MAAGDGSKSEVSQSGGAAVATSEHTLSAARTSSAASGAEARLLLSSAPASSRIAMYPVRFVPINVVLAAAMTACE